MLTRVSAQRRGLCVSPYYNVCVLENVIFDTADFEKRSLEGPDIGNRKRERELALFLITGYKFAQRQRHFMCRLQAKLVPFLQKL